MIKVAICQCGSLGTPEENMANMVRLFKKAVENAKTMRSPTRLPSTLTSPMYSLTP